VYYNTPDLPGSYPAASERVLPNLPNLLWDHLALPLALRKDGIDVAIYPKGTISLVSPSKDIPIVLDLGYFYPQINAYKKLDTWYMRTALRFSAHRSWGIFAISQYTADDVVRFFGVPQDKVQTIYGGADRELFAPVSDPAKLSAVEQAYNLQRPYIFCPTSISPRKNIDRLLDAFERVQGRIPHHLYFTGGLSWNSAKTTARLRYPLDRRVHRLGHVPVADMPAIYTLADFTVYISLFEGFGLPVVESFLCETPVLASDQTSLPEVAGDAALLIPARDTDAIAQALLRLAQDADLRASLVVRGKRQAQQFTWEKTAQTALKWIEMHVAA
jgi:glycosyltransferase involved in cell wall biosynthesis